MMIFDLHSVKTFLFTNLKQKSPLRAFENFLLDYEPVVGLTDSRFTIQQNVLPLGVRYYVSTLALRNVDIYLHRPLAQFVTRFTTNHWTISCLIARSLNMFVGVTLKEMSLPKWKSISVAKLSCLYLCNRSIRYTGNTLDCKTLL